MGEAKRSSPILAKTPKNANNEIVTISDACDDILSEKDNVGS